MRKGLRLVVDDMPEAALGAEVNITLAITFAITFATTIAIARRSARSRGRDEAIVIAIKQQ